jgi:hypothetical protein
LNIRAGVRVPLQHLYSISQDEMAIKTVLFTVFFTLMYKTEQTTAQVNRKGDIVYGNFEKMPDGHIFEKNGTLLKNFTSNRENDCLLECVKQDKCLSLNLYFDQPNQFQCELLSWGGTAVHRYLKPRANSYSMQLKVNVDLNIRLRSL